MGNVAYRVAETVSRNDPKMNMKSVLYKVKKDEVNSGFSSDSSEISHEFDHDCEMETERISFYSPVIYEKKYENLTHENCLKMLFEWPSRNDCYRKTVENKAL
jgi:hypothetical protein